MNRREEPALDQMARQVRAVIRTGHARGVRGHAAWLAAAVAAAALLAWWLWPGEETVRWQTHTVDRGDMLLTATATGNLEPKSEVTVGAEISGRIAEVMVDENDVVEAGEILALFDTEELRVALEQALARLALAKASVEENEATLEETLLDERRSESIMERGSGSQAELDRARAARKRASANLTYARAAVREAEAAVSAARTRLSKAVISSPIDGVVLQRNIERAGRQLMPAQPARRSVAAPAILQMQCIYKIYGSGWSEVRALDGVDLSIHAGEFVAVMGPSGSGKSTCMNILGCLDVPTAGKYWFCGIDVGELNRDELALLRRHYMGFVFQSFNLLPRLSAVGNVEMPLIYEGVNRSTRRERALAALESMGLADRATAAPNQLSGGQQQRVAIARALVTEPSLLLADEPTGNLDTATAGDIMTLPASIRRERDITIVMVTHEPHIAVYAQRVLDFVDGRLVRDGPPREVLQ